MEQIEIINDKFNDIVFGAVLDCDYIGNDVQIIFDGEDFHVEPVIDKSFIIGYFIERKSFLGAKSMRKVATKHIIKCLDYFLKVKSLEIILI